MLHLRLVVPSDEVGEVVQMLERAPEVTSVWHVPGAGRKPEGDLVACDVAEEEASAILAQLREIGVADRGSIAVEHVDAAVSRGAEAAELAARGWRSDAVVWEEVSERVSESVELSVNYLALMTIATLIAAAGVLTDSIVLIIGAMVVGPEFGPLAGIAVAVVQRRWHLARRSLAALAAGFPVAIGVTAGATVAAREAGLIPETEPGQRVLTQFIANPTWLSFLVAVLAGVAGMLAVTSQKSGALVGVLISVTTIPAAGNVGVAIAYGDTSEALGAAAQLAVNLSAIIISGILVLAIERRSFAARSDRRHASTPSPTSLR